AEIFQGNDDVPSEAVGELGYVEHEPSVAVRESENDPPHVEFIVSAISEEETANSSQPYRRSNFSAHERDADQVAARIAALTGGTDLSLGDEKNNTVSSLGHIQYR